VPRTGRVVAHHRGRYIVRADGIDYDAIVGGAFIHHTVDSTALPAVGDHVALALTRGDGTTRIESVLPRRSALIRKAAGDSTEAQVLAANVDLVLIASALPHDVNLRRIERYLTLAWESGATPVVILTKADLADDVAAAVDEARSVAIGADVLAVSTRTGQGIPDLRAQLAAGVTAVLLGSSGAGKSTLVNALLGADRQRTSATRDDGAGRHTTTHRELVELPSGAFLIDTPGLREVGLWTSDSGIERSFADLETFAERCRFANCAHDTEPDCAVLAAIDAGVLAADRLESWRALQREIAFLERKLDPAAAAEAKRRAKSLDRLGRGRIRKKYE
jgi:ribosome biogenesis GTPase